jgi:hypothetical protein
MQTTTSLRQIDWNRVTSEEFWRVADELQRATLSEATELFSCVPSLSPEELRSVLIQYRYFTVYYIPDLSLLITRMKNEVLRSFLADILWDELGRGNSALAHPRLYDDFMKSIGASDYHIQSSALTSNIALLDDARRQLVSPYNRWEFGVGLRGMGGECVCQVYIARLYEQLIKNPFIATHNRDIDWRFWSLHVGDHDIQHGHATRAVIDREVVQLGGSGLLALGTGFGYSMKSWRLFWRNIFQEMRRPTHDVERAFVRSFADVALVA